ncbi:MAG: long-chain acyl-CoA synthetase, partial [Thermoleophilaceae bacterium]|nr:long-chain acyl-CoA synthetase [Thermoleophilaceae bacterium]
MASLAAVAAQRYAGHPALRHKVDDQWTDVDYAELGASVSEVARGLMDLGIGRGDRVSILANTRPEWTYANL